MTVYSSATEFGTVTDTSAGADATGSESPIRSRQLAAVVSTPEANVRTTSLLDWVYTAETGLIIDSPTFEAVEFVIWLETLINS